MIKSLDNYSRLYFIMISILSFIFYIVGLFTPLYTSTHFYIFSKETSLFQSVLLLFNHKEIYLGVLILLFTILLPLAKFIVIFLDLLHLNKQIGHKILGFLAFISKWAMLDVFVVAILLLNMKFDSRIIDMKLGQGIVWFSLSIILLLITLAYSGNSAFIKDVKKSELQEIKSER